MNLPVPTTRLFHRLGNAYLYQGGEGYSNSTPTGTDRCFSHDRKSLTWGGLVGEHATELRCDFRPIPGRKFVTLSVGNSPCPYGVSYRRGDGLSTSGSFKKSLCSPLCGPADLLLSPQPTLATSAQIQVLLQHCLPGMDEPHGVHVGINKGRSL